MPAFEPQTPDYAARVRDSFARQQVMHTIGACLLSVAPGLIEIELPFRADLTQQQGFLHAGIVTTIADSACGYAALSLMPADADVLSIEFKINMLAPAVGERLIARGRVIRAGRNITVCASDVLAFRDGAEKIVATMLATMMMVRGQSNSAG